MLEYTNQSSDISQPEKPNKLGKHFVFLLLILATILAVGGILFATKFVSKEVEESDTQVLPVVLKPGSVNFIAIDLDADGKKETISFDQTRENCGSGGCALRVDGSMVISNAYAPVYGVFVDGKISQFIVEQKVETEGCDANACMRRSLVLYDFDLATKSATKVSEDVEISENAVLLFTTEVIDETADWQTYRNEEYGLEFKYPISFSLEEKKGFSIRDNCTTVECAPGKYSEILTGADWRIVLTSKDLSQRSVSISILKFSDTEYVEQICYEGLCDFYDLFEDKDFVIDNSNISIGKVPGIVYDSIFNPAETVSRKIVLFTLNQRIVISSSYIDLENLSEWRDFLLYLRSHYVPNWSIARLDVAVKIPDSFFDSDDILVNNYSAFRRDFDKIISTFKFTK